MDDKQSDLARIVKSIESDFLAGGREALHKLECYMNSTYSEKLEEHISKYPTSFNAGKVAVYLTATPPLTIYLIVKDIFKSC